MGCGGDIKSQEKGYGEENIIVNDVGIIQSQEKGFGGNTQSLGLILQSQSPGLFLQSQSPGLIL